MVLHVIWVHIPCALVLCNNLILQKLLSKGSKGTNRTCCQCNRCSNIYNCSAYCNTCYLHLIFGSLLVPCPISKKSQNVTSYACIERPMNINGVANFMVSL
ncbi:hypothetical protein R6Q57_028931 [Mikania cordata]